MTELAKLIERVEAATEDNQALALWDAFSALVPVPNEDAAFHYLFTEFMDSRAYTDAALALVERVLPGWKRSVGETGIKNGTHQDGKTAYVDGWRASVTERSALRPMPSVADARTAPLAILLALLRALSARSP